MSNRMGKEKRGPLALELWAKQLTDGYQGVTVRNMTTSWRNGLAFCALIHRFRPDLIDFDKLDGDDIIGNCSLAFDVAESKLGIPSLLDPIDMAAMDIPDRLSVLTYVAQFYNAFKNSEAKSRIPPRQNDEVGENDVLKKRAGDKSGSSTPDKIISKRKNEGVDEDEIMDKVRRSMPKKSVLLSSARECSECKNFVFISERVLFMKKLYHRSCFRCSNCKNPLNPHIVDVSSDGSLYCLEKTCHAELIIKSPIDKNIPSLDNMQKGNNLVKTNEAIIIETRHDGSNSSFKPNLNVEGASYNVLEDSKSQGDMQISALPSTPAPTTPRNTKRMLDFAGALLHSEVEEDTIRTLESESPIQNSDAVELVEKVVDQGLNDIVENDNVVDTTNQKELLQESSTTESKSDESFEVQQEVESKSTNTIELKRAEEITSIREKAILTVADQFKVFIEKSDDECNEPPDFSESEELVPEEENSTMSLENKEVTKVERSDSPAASTVSEHSLKHEQETTTEIKDSSISNFLEKGDASEMGTTESLTVSPVIFSTSNNDSPSPVPKKRPPKPPPPKIYSPPSPSPRSRNLPKADELKTTSELWRNKDYYPQDLNPFGSEEDLSEESNANNQVNRAEPKNPFEDDEDEVELPPPSPVPKPRNTTPNPSNMDGNGNIGTPPFHKNAANFNLPPPRPPPPNSSPRKLAVNSKAYNPFEDDEDDIGEYEEDKLSGPSPKPFAEDASSISSKTSGLSSISGVPTPTPRSLNASDTEGAGGSLKLRSRKSRRAPLPPNMTLQSPPEINISRSPESLPIHQRKVIPVSPKLLKALKFPSSSPSPGTLTHRKKRRAPPPRRRVEPLPEEAIKTEFADLEIQLKELERQGIAFETKIRTVMESSVDNHETENDEQAENAGDIDAANNTEQLDEMMVQLWAIVNEKNDILRRQTELEYLRRGHRLEEMQAELDFKLRVLMETPEDQKQPNQADMEEVLIQQLMKLVDERNEVVEWLDYHRQLDREEEMLLTKSITEFSNNKPVEPIPESSTSSKSKKEKKEKKPKEEKEKKHGKLKLGIFKKSKKSKPDEAKMEP